MILFNKVLHSGKWPFTENNLVILLKKPGRKDYSNTSNYRPITLSSVCGKLFEKILEARLRAITEEYNWLGDNQHGFRKNKSTGTYLSHMLSVIQHNCSRKYATAGIFVDLQKAFDSVWQDGMLYKLKELGFGSKFLKLIHSFLKDRKVKIRVNNYTSDAKSCQIGLPQGSILSPLLFITYIADMMKGIDGLPLQYADDCSIICWKPNQTELNETLTSTCRKITNWLSKWRLKVNCSKTDLVCFRGQPPQLEMSSENINIATETKVLGLIVDHKLTFRQHKNMANATLVRNWNMLLPYMLHGLSPKVIKTILNTVIIPKVFHNAFLWDSNSSMSLHCCLKDLLGVPFNPATDTLHKLADIPTLPIKYKADVFNLCRLAARDSILCSILHQTKSNIQKTIRSCLVKLLGRHFDSQNIRPDHFKRSNIKEILKSEALASWKTHMQQGHNGEGLLSQLEITHLDNSPIPLTLPRHITGQLCAVLTGHAKLQAFLYKIQYTYTPTCTCLLDDETVFHYLFSCPNYHNLRNRLNLDGTSHLSLLTYIRESGRFTD